MPTAIKWETMDVLVFPYYGEKKVKLEVGTKRVAPVSAKPPPPAPPYAYSSDRVVGKGPEKGKWEGSKGKGPKGKGGKGEPNGGQTLTKVEEENHEDDASHYSPSTEREKKDGDQ